jgi:hypothetical protein
MDIDPEKVRVPQKPRFTLADLQEIRIATGDGETTIAGYTYTYKGQTVNRYAAFEDLTHAEREAALEFILKYSKTQAIRRKAKPRGKAVAGKPKKPAPLNPADITLDEISLDDIKFDPPELMIELPEQGIQNTEKND